MPSSVPRPPRPLSTYPPSPPLRNTSSQPTHISHSYYSSHSSYFRTARPIPPISSRRVPKPRYGSPHDTLPFPLINNPIHRGAATASRLRQPFSTVSPPVAGIAHTPGLVQPFASLLSCVRPQTPAGD